MFTKLRVVATLVTDRMPILPRRSRPDVAAEEDVVYGGLVERDVRPELRAHEQRYGHERGQGGQAQGDQNRGRYRQLGEVGLDDAAVAVEGDRDDAQARHEDGSGLAGVGQLAHPLGVDAERPAPVQDLQQRQGEETRAH